MMASIFAMSKVLAAAVEVAALLLADVPADSSFLSLFEHASNIPPVNTTVPKTVNERFMSVIPL